jgi:uncharacterized protein (DUF433 family)
MKNSRLSVAWVIRVAKSYDMDAEKVLAHWPDRPREWLQAALNYYSAFSEEIDTELELMTAEAELETLKRRFPMLESFIAQRIRQKQPDLPIDSLHGWQEGNLMGKPDSSVLRAAHEAGMVVVTFDTQILSELYFWFEEARPFGGLLFPQSVFIVSEIGLFTLVLFLRQIQIRFI